MYLSAYLSYMKDYLYKDEFTKQFINRIENKPKEWNQAIKFSAKKIADDLIEICVQNPPKIIKNELIGSECEFFEYWTNNRTGKWELIKRFFAEQQRPSTCEDWEQFKVAKGMKCLRLSTNQPDYVKY